MRRSINSLNDVKAYNEIKRIIKEFRPDIVHTHAAKAGALGRWAAYSLDVPVIIHTYHGHVFHSYFNKYKTAIFKGIERNLAQKSTRIIAISDIQKYELTEIHHICPPEKVSVIPLGFDLTKFHENISDKRAAFRKKYLLEDDEIAIGIIGRLAPVKNHELFIKSIRHLKENSAKKFRAFIIGDGDQLQKIEAIATELNLDFVEFVKEQRKAELTFTSWIKELEFATAGLDIIALTSLNEGTPVSLIEAQAANKPIVTTNVGGIENVVIPGKTALLSEVNDEQGFSDNLLKLVNDDSLRTSLSDSGWEHVGKKFHYTRLVADMKQLYDSLLK